MKLEQTNGEKKILKQPNENLVRDYNIGFMFTESEDFIKDENGNVVEEEE